jgi:hypothetical protein
VEGGREGEGSKAERGDEYCLRKGAPCTDLVISKDFLRFHIALSRGRIKDETTVDSVKTFAEWFFAGFTRVTGTVVSDDYRKGIYAVRLVCFIVKMLY